MVDRRYGVVVVGFVLLAIICFGEVEGRGCYHAFRSCLDGVGEWNYCAKRGGIGRGIGVN